MDAKDQITVEVCRLSKKKKESNRLKITPDALSSPCQKPKVSFASL